MDARVPPIQDMPPPGGYEKVSWLGKPRGGIRNGFLVFGIATGVTGFLLYVHHRQKRMERWHSLEDHDAKTAMLPFLKAEEDRLKLTIMRQNREMEKELMADVPDWKTGTYMGTPIYYNMNYFDFPSSIELGAHRRVKKISKLA